MCGQRVRWRKDLDQQADVSAIDGRRDPGGKAQDILAVARFQRHRAGTDRMSCRSGDRGGGIRPREPDDGVSDRRGAAIMNARPQERWLTGGRTSRRPFRICPWNHPNVGADVPRISVIDVKLDGHASEDIPHSVSASIPPQVKATVAAPVELSWNVSGVADGEHAQISGGLASVQSTCQGCLIAVDITFMPVL